MKVLCISEDTKTVQGPETPTLLKVGNVYTAIREKHEPDGIYYELEEIPKIGGRSVLFSQHMFMPLSDIDETELLKQREQDLIYH